MKKSSYLIFLLYSIFLLAFFFNADPNGGAYKDYLNHINVFEDFKENFINTLFNYDKYSTRHSPVLYIFISILYKIGISDFFVRLISVHVCIFLIFIFYKCLVIKFKSVNKNNLILFSGIIFLSPSFWSLSIWPDSRIFGLLFFCLSIFYFLKFKENNNFKNSLKCVFAYSAASYLSPNFSLFSLYFFYEFYKKFGLKKELIIIVLLNIILALPAFIYLFSLDEIFLFKSAVPSDLIREADYLNIANKILIISSIIFFYFIPFLISDSLGTNIKLNNFENLIISFLILILCIFYFDYNYLFTGGGFFFKASYFLSKNNYIFYFICFFSIFYLVNICKYNFENFFLILLLLLSNPQYTIYHKYYDPLLLIIFSLLFNLNLNKKKLFNYRSIIIFYLHIGSFLILNFLK